MDKITMSENLLDLQEIGKRIRTQREELGITRDELARRAGITSRFCYDIELGLKGMSLETLCNIKDILHMSTDYILFGNESDRTEMDSILTLLESSSPNQRRSLEKMLYYGIRAIKEP